MANLVLDSQKKVKEAENLILDKYKDSNFLIDKNSIISNIDVLEDYFSSKMLSDK
jgi:hypothetical protein